MNTLSSAPVATLLERLFTEAEAADPMGDPALAAVPADERMRLMRSRTEYSTFY